MSEDNEKPPETIDTRPDVNPAATKMLERIIAGYKERATPRGPSASEAERWRDSTVKDTDSGIDL